MGHAQNGASIPRNIILQPRNGPQIQMVGGFIQQQQIRFQKQGARQSDTHPPTARKFRERAGLRRRIKTKPGKHRRRPRRRAIGANGDQPFMNFRNAGGISRAFRFSQ